MGDSGVEAHEAFQGAGEKAGLEIWRIEKFNPVKRDPKTHGEFYTGDAYIVLDTKQRKGSSKFDYNIHFWLGKSCAQDEAGTAAIRTVELDEHVAGGGAVQHREVQGHESKLFSSYFKKGMKYLEGGVESGFKKIADIKYQTRLFQLKGKANIRIEQVECKCGSLNQGDVFILDTDKHIYIWIGPNSNKVARLTGVETARRIRDDEKGGRSHLHIVEKDWDSNEGFFKALGSRDKEIKARDTNEDDSDVVRKLDAELLLYKISPPEVEGSKFVIEEVGARPLSRTVLESDSCFVMDSGYSGIYVWTGKLCTVAFKKEVWKGVNEFISKRGYPSWITVTRVVDGGESAIFKQYFPDWLEHDATPIEVDTGGNVAKQDDREFDATAMHSKAGKAQDYMPDDGSGKVEVYRIENLELSPVAEEVYGVFFGGDSYVIKYTYEKDGKPAYIIYFWQGLASTTDEKGASALQAMKLDDELGGEAMQVRVVMNKEPAHFLKMFKGKMLVFMGGHASGFRNVHDHDTFNPRDPIMFHIRGDNNDNTRALQVEARANSLNTNDVFVVENPKENKCYVWAGKHCDENEIAMAKLMVDIVTVELNSEPVIMEEGEESPAFWNTIGGEEEYYKGPKKSDGVRVEPRLFLCSNASGRFIAEEIVDFDQEDLDETSCMILDTFDEVFVWIGEEANAVEKRESLKTSYNYLESDPSGRNQDNTIIVVVRQGFEPPQFTGHFHAWDTQKWAEGKSFDELLQEVGQENAGINLLEDEVKKYTANYPIDVLRRSNPPEGVDVTHKEMYLSDEDFQEVFGMTKDDFNALPEWKRITKKKEVDLF